MPGPLYIVDSPANTFDTFTALYDARDAGDLVAGTVYRVAWSGDPYAPDGEFVTKWTGAEFTVHPFDVNIEYPAWLWDASDWATTDGSGTYVHSVFSQDADGRPQLSSNAGAGVTGFCTLVLSDRFAFYRPRKVSVRAEWDFAARSTDDRSGFRILNRDDRTQDEVLVYFRYSSAAVNDFLVSVKEAGAALNSFTSQAGGDPWVGSLHLSAAPEPIPSTPNWYAQSIFDASPNYSAVNRSNGHGNWRTGAGYPYVFSIYSTFEDSASLATIRTIQINAEATP